MIRLMAKLIAALLAIYAAGVALTMLSARNIPATAPTGAQLIVVLSGDYLPREKLAEYTKSRVDHGIALYKQGVAPLMVMSGGTQAAAPAPIVADVMRRYAIAQGVPANAVLTEGRSHSTLQNALFTANLRPKDLEQPIVLVTSRFHALRSKLSFRWAGFRQITLSAPAIDPPGGSYWIPMEGIKWPVNIARGGLFSILRAIGVPQHPLDRILA